MPTSVTLASPYNTRSRSISDRPTNHPSSTSDFRTGETHASPHDHSDDIHSDSAEPLTVLDHIIHDRAQGLRELRELWKRGVIDGSAGTRSTLDELLSHTDPKKIEASKQKIQSEMSKHCIIHAKQLEESAYHLSIFRLFALFGHDGVKSKWFLQALRDYAKHEPDLAIALATFRAQQTLRRTGEAKLSGVQLAPEWALSDITQSSKQMEYKLPERRGKLSRDSDKRKSQGRSRESTEETEISVAPGMPAGMPGRSITVSSTGRLLQQIGNNLRHVGDIGTGDGNEGSGREAGDGGYAIAGQHVVVDGGLNGVKESNGARSSSNAQPSIQASANAPGPQNHLHLSINGKQYRPDNPPRVLTDTNTGGTTCHVESDNSAFQSSTEETSLLYSLFDDAPAAHNRPDTIILSQAQHINAHASRQSAFQRQLSGNMTSKKRLPESPTSMIDTPSKRRCLPSPFSTSLDNAWLRNLCPSPWATTIKRQDLARGYWWTDASTSPSPAPGEAMRLEAMRFKDRGTFITAACSGTDTTPEAASKLGRWQLRGFAWLDTNTMEAATFGLTTADCEIAGQKLEELIQQPAIYELFHERPPDFNSRCVCSTTSTPRQSNIFNIAMLSLAMNGSQPPSLLLEDVWLHCMKVCEELCDDESFERETELDITSLLKYNDASDSPQAGPRNLHTCTVDALDASISRQKEIVRSELAHVQEIIDQLHHIRSFIVTARERMSDVSSLASRLQAAIAGISAMVEPREAKPDLLISYERQFVEVESSVRQATILEQLVDRLGKDLAVCSGRVQSIREKAKAALQAKADEYEDFAKGMRERAALLEKEAVAVRAMKDFN